MAEHKIGLSLDVKNTTALDRLQHEFKDIGDAADKIRARFERLDQYSNRMMKNGFGSQHMTRELRDQLSLVREMARVYENEARRTGNESALGRLQSTRQSIGTLSGELESYGGLQGRSWRGRLGGFGRTVGYAALGYAGTRPLAMFRAGYGEAYGMLPGLANFSQTMAPSTPQATNAWAYSMLGSAQGYGYNNQDIFGGAQQLQSAMGRSRLFNNYMKGIAQFGRYNGFDFTQAAGAFSSEYQAGMQMNPLQYAILVANTVNQANMQGRNGQVVNALQQMTQTVSGSMMGLSNGAMNGVSSMYATVGRTGNQALINTFPSIFNEMNASIQGGTSLGPMGQAAQWQALSGGKPMNYWQAMFLQSQGAMGLGPNGKRNWQNKLQYAFNQFGGNSDEDYVLGGQFMGVSPTEMQQLIQTFMPNGKFTMANANTTAGKKLLNQIKGGDMSPLDKTNQNFTQASQNFQKASSDLLGAASKLDSVLGAHPYLSAGAGAVAAGIAGHGLLSGLLGRGGGGLFGGGLGSGIASGVGKSAKSGVSFLGRFGKWARGLIPGLGGDAAIAGGDAALIGGLEATGGALDATGVGAIAGVPLNIIGAVLAAGGIGAITSRMFGGSGKSSGSSSKPSAKMYSSSSDIQAEVTNVVAVLMAMRPWASQIQQWYGGQSSSSGSLITRNNSISKRLSPVALSHMELYSQVAGQSGAGTGLSLQGPSLPPTQTYKGSGEKQFIYTMKPYALQTAAKMGVPKQYRNNVAEFLLAEWGKESGWGTSVAAKENDNFAGIKPPGSGHYAGVDHTYAGYSSLSDFANGDAYYFTHNSNYAKFTQAARKGASPRELAALLGATPYAQDPTYGYSISHKFLPGVQSLYSSAPSTIKISAPKTITVQIQDPSGNLIGTKIVHLTTTATYNGQK